MVIKNYLKKTFVVLLAAIMIFVSMGFTNEVEAKVTKVPQPTIVYKASTSDKYKGEYYAVATPKDKPNYIYVYGKTKINVKRFCIKVNNRSNNKRYITVFVTPNKQGEFYVRINTKAGNSATPTILKKKGTVVGKSGSYSTTPGYNAVQKMPKGTYQINITRALTTKDADVSKGTKWWNGPLGGNGVGCFATKGFTLKTTSKTNDLKLVTYKSVISGNASVRAALEKTKYTSSDYKGSYVRYTDPLMQDMNFVFVNPKTGKSYPMTAAKAKYIKSLAQTVTKGASSNYSKLAKIYEFVSKTFYYDSYAKDYLSRTGINREYVNPYDNLYNSQHSVTSANSIGKKVATTCQGYSAMVIAMARALGIPARTVQGHHVIQPGKIWANETSSSVQKNNHWWVEAYVNSRWITIDADEGSQNSWQRKSFSDKGTWAKSKAINYTAFDPSNDYFSNSHSLNEIRQGSNLGKYVCNANEIKKLRSFLNTKNDEGTLNGKLINSKYSSADYSTWGKDNLFTNGFGRVYSIKWQSLGLVGDISLNSFSKLKHLTLNGNNLTGISLNSCKSLKYISVANNKLTSFDSTSSPKLETISAKYNKFTTAKFLDSGNQINIKTNIPEGNFAFYYKKSNSKRLEIVVGKAPTGYKFKGIYKGSTLVSTSTDYSFNPSSGTYTVQFEKN